MLPAKSPDLQLTEVADMSMTKGSRSMRLVPPRRRSRRHDSPPRPLSVHSLDELDRRPTRQRDPYAELAATERLTQVLETEPGSLPDRLVREARTLCHAGCTGISLLEHRGSGDVFRWEALAGDHAPAVNTEPYDASPCAHVIARGSALLFTNPSADFPILRDADPTVSEALVVPLHVDGGPVGTLWAVHHGARRFQSADAQLLARLSRFASIALRLNRSIAELSLIDRRREEFVASLSHELRNPLAPVQIAAHLLTDPRLEPRQLAWARGVIQRQVSRLGLLLDDLLDVALLTQGKLHLRTERMRPAEILHTAVEAAQPLIERDRHELTVHLPADIDRVAIEADPLRVVQVVSNLLMNAAKCTSAGGRIELQATVERGMLCIAVRDDGTGMTPHALEEMSKFLSCKEGTLLGFRVGLGVDLTVTRELVRLQGGTMEARSAGTGRGSTLLVRFPLAAPLAPTCAGTADRPLAQTSQRHPTRTAQDGRAAPAADV